MKKKWYNVRTTQSVLYEQEVLARGPEEACEEAEAQIAGGKAYPVEGDYDFDSEVTGSRPHTTERTDRNDKRRQTHPPYIILRFTRSYSVFRSFSKEQTRLMQGFFGILCRKPQAEALCAYSKQNVVLKIFEKASCVPASPAVA